LSFIGIPYTENVSLIGATLSEISDIINRYIQAYENMHTIIHAYFSLAEEEYWKPEKADFIGKGQYSIVPVPPGELTKAWNLRNWEYSFNQVLNDLPIKEKEYLDMIKEMQYRIPFIAELYIQKGIIQILLVKDIIRRFEIEVLGDTFQNVQNSIIARTDQYQQIYINKINRYWELQRKLELTIRMEQKYPPIQTSGYRINIIEFNVITNDEMNELNALEGYEVGNARNDYIDKVNDEDRAHKVGVRFPDTPGAVPLNLSLLPIKPQPIRPTALETELEARNRYPPLPDRELSDKEQWNIKYGNTIKREDNIMLNSQEQINQIQRTYGTYDCTQIPENLYLDCEYWNMVYRTSIQNLEILIKIVEYPEDPEARLLIYPSRPTQDDINAYIAQKEAERQAEEEALARAILMRQLQDVYRAIEDARGKYRYAALNWVGLVKSFGPNDPETVKARANKETLFNQFIALLDDYETRAGFFIKEHLQMLIDEFLSLIIDQRNRGSEIGAMTLESEVDILRRTYDMRYRVIDPTTHVLTRDEWYLERFGNR
jgi:hypothetical protein